MDSRLSADHERVGARSLHGLDLSTRPLAFPVKTSLESTRSQAPPPSRNPFLTLHPSDPFGDPSLYTPASAPPSQQRFPEFADIPPPSPTSSLRPRLRINTMTSDSTSSAPRPHFPHPSVDGSVSFASRSTTSLPVRTNPTSHTHLEERTAEPTRSGFRAWARNLFSGSRSRTASTAAPLPPPPTRRARPPREPLPSFPPPPAHRVQSYTGMEKAMAGDHRYTVWEAPNIIVSRG